MANTFPILLTDGGGYIWDITSSGQVDGDTFWSGNQDGFDGGYTLTGFDDADGTTVESEGGRQHLFEDVIQTNLNVKRKIYVPTDDGWLRYFDTFTNTSGAQKTYTISYNVNLGSDGSTNILQTSSGDTTLASPDYYVISDDSADGNGGNDPVITTFFGDGTVDANFMVPANGIYEGSATFTLDPGESTSLLYFSAQNESLAQAQADLHKFQAPSGAMLQGLSAAEIANIANYTGLTARAAPTGPVLDFTSVSMSTNSGNGFAIDMDYAAYVSHSALNYIWTTTAGHKITAYGSGIAVDGSNSPTAGSITKITIDLNDDDAELPDIVIDNLSVTLTDLNFAAGSAADNTFWSVVMDGDSTIIGSPTSADGLIGDFENISTAGVHRGDDDVFKGGGNFSRAFGDAVNISDGTVIGGVDRFEDVFGFTYGDFRNVLGGVAIGGSDVLELTNPALPATSNLNFYADGLIIDGTGVLVGGDDIVTVDGAPYIIGKFFGDVVSIGNAAIVYGGDDNIRTGNNVDLIMGDAGEVMSSSATLVAGDDSIDGGGGNDTIYGDVELFSDIDSDFTAGHDTLRGGEGEDKIYGDYRVGNSTSAGHDTLYGDAGNDSLYGGYGNDTLDGGAGNDFLFGGAGFDSIDGGDDIDTVDFSSFGSAVWVDLAYAGNEAWTQDDADAVDPTGTWREFANLDNVENVIGTAGNDLLRGDSGANTIEGGDGDDSLWLVTSNRGTLDLLDGGNDTDTVNFSTFGSAVWVDLAYAGNEAWTQDDADAVNPTGTWREIANLDNVENVIGTDAVDLLRGDANNNQFGYVGISSLTGIEQIDGRDGSDTVDFSAFGSAVWLDLAFAGNEAWTQDDADAVDPTGIWREIANLDNVENVIGTAGNDLLRGDSGANTIEGGDGDDSLWLVTSNRGTLDLLDGGNDTDTVNFSTFGSAVWVDLAYAGNEAWTQDDADAVDPTGTWREIANLDNVEKVIGTDGNDLLRGDSGANVIRGGDGNDSMSAGGIDMAEDHFVFDDADGNDVIDNFEIGIDLIGFTGMVVDQFSDLSFSEINGNAVINYGLGASEQITVNGVDQSQLEDLANFFFI